MRDVHIFFGVLAIALTLLAGLLGAWCWWRATSSPWFWRCLRAGQAAVVIEALIGGAYQLIGPKAPSIHVIYGLLPLAVSFVAEQLRVAAAQMILDQRGFESAKEVGTLPDDEQQRLVVAIVQRELGVMTVAAAVIVVLLARAAGTA